MTVPKMYGRTALTGGAVGALDAIDGAKLNDGDSAIVITSGGLFYPYRLNATSGAAESSPNVISPDANAGTKRWILIPVMPVSGTWPMGVSFGGATTGITYNAAFTTGCYSRIGNIVNVTGAVVLTSKGSATGAARITGLPFTCANSNAAYSAASLHLEKVTFANQHQGYVEINATTIRLTETTEAGVKTDLDDTNFANDSTILLSATYRIA